jgi:hypothetical protein
MSMTRNLAIAVALLAASVALPTYAQQAPARGFDPVGRWRFHHTDGTAFIARLAADQTAATDWEGGEHGIWRWEGSAVRVIYTDGWDDLLVLGAGGIFTKKGWSPEADRCAAASNETPAQRLSTDPGPQLRP